MFAMAYHKTRDLIQKIYQTPLPRALRLDILKKLSGTPAGTP